MQGLLSAETNNAKCNEEVQLDKKMLEMKSRKHKKRKHADNGRVAGRWTKKEHEKFVKG